MHLFFNHVPPKVVQTYMGHERYESTEVYLKVFALDVAPQLGGDVLAGSPRIHAPADAKIEYLCITLVIHNDVILYYIICTEADDKRAFIPSKNVGATCVSMTAIRYFVYQDHQGESCWESLRREN